MTDADEKLERYVLKAFREEYPPSTNPNYVPTTPIRHLADCPDLKVEHPEMYNGAYGCDTGCEYARLEARISCPHSFSENYEYGTFGEIPDLIEQLDKL